MNSKIMSDYHIFTKLQSSEHYEPCRFLENADQHAVRTMINCLTMFVFQSTLL